MTVHTEREGCEDFDENKQKMQRVKPLTFSIHLSDPLNSHFKEKWIHPSVIESCLSGKGIRTAVEFSVSPDLLCAPEHTSSRQPSTALLRFADLLVLMSHGIKKGNTLCHNKRACKCRSHDWPPTLQIWNFTANCQHIPNNWIGQIIHFHFHYLMRDLKRSLNPL